MKSSNLAWRIEPPEELNEPTPPGTTERPVQTEPRERMRPRARFERRTIEIRDQGLAPFRVR